jgi:hypothetical protein
MTNIQKWVGEKQGGGRNFPILSKRGVGRIGLFWGFWGARIGGPLEGKREYAFISHFKALFSPLWGLGGIGYHLDA